MQTKVAELIKVNSMDEADKMTGTKVREAVCIMKPYKGDVSKGYTSDALLHGTDILFDLLAMIFQRLVCAWNSKPSSYRAIPGFSLLPNYLKR